MSQNQGAPKPLRRALDRAESRVLELEERLLAEIARHGLPSFDHVINLSIAYVDRARERIKRGTETPEDIRILEKVTK